MHLCVSVAPYSQTKWTNFDTVLFGEAIDSWIHFLRGFLIVFNDINIILT